MLADGTWTYTVNSALPAVQSLAAGVSAVDTIAITSLDGSATSTLTVAINGTNDPATISDTATGTVTEDGGTDLDPATEDTVSGSLSIDDLDNGENALNPVAAGTAGDNGYGTFEVLATGDWTYTLDNTNVDVQALDSGETLTDTLTVTSVDGTASETLTITIEGAPDFVFDIEDVGDRLDGFVINGELASDATGVSVSGGGDVDGDGFADLVVGARTPKSNPSESGSAYVVFGKTDEDAVDLSDVSGGTGGFIMAPAGSTVVAVSDAGDLNGDGRADVIIGASLGDPIGSIPGAGFAVFGKADGTPIDLTAVAGGTGGFLIQGISLGDQVGRSVSSAGDVNGDGLADLIIGAPYDEPSGEKSGSSFVVFGKTDGNVVDLADIEAGIGGFVIEGRSAGGEFGRSVSNAGDVNGDGLDDLIVGAPYDDSNGTASGLGYVVFGKADGSKVDLSDIADGTGGFLINGDTPEISVSGGGDVNGDGLDDLVVGAKRETPAGIDSGAAYVVFGKVSGDAVDLDDIADGTGGFAINGPSQSARSGESVAIAGDVNGDGYDDVLLGAPRDRLGGEVNAGSATVVFGKADGTAVDLADVQSNSGQGIVIKSSERADILGTDVAGAGDVNGDGFDDIIFGVPRRDLVGSSYAGQSVVVFGGDFSGAVTEIGDENGQSLFGSVDADVIVAGGGDDSLVGNGGADVLRAGAGNDGIFVRDLDFKVVDGGTGTDSLVLLGSDLVLDLTAIAGPRIDSIELIDLAGGDNVVRLDPLSVLRLSETTNTLRVVGDASTTDTAILEGAGWVAAGTVNVGRTTFNVFTDGLARVEIQDGVQINGGPIAPIDLGDIEAATDPRGFAILGAGEF
ncbi:MAG: VCBS domain-containing protein, partial [Pseudomonadota bacterium]